MKKHPIFLFIVVLLAFSGVLQGQESQTMEEPQKEVEITIPNPIKLQPEWYLYLDVDSKKLQERIDVLKSHFSHLLNQFKDTKEKQEAEKRVKEIHSHLESLALLKAQEIEKPIFAWIPKDSYTLDDYIDLSDRIRELTRDISYKYTDLKRFKYSSSNLRQNLNNTYAQYLSLTDPTKEKFLLGLKVMSLGARFLYLEAEIELTSQLIQVDKEMLERYKSERELVDEKLTFEFNLEEVNQEKDQINQEIATIHSELLSLESESIKTFTQARGEEATRLINQKLTNTLIKEALLRTKITLLDAKETLYHSLHTPDEVSYKKDLEPIKNLRNDIREQLIGWEEVVVAEINQLSQFVVKVNGETTEEERAQSYEETLQISLSNRALLDALSQELYHVKLVLDLIDQNILKRQELSDQITYTAQNLWHWLNETIGKWLYFSLFEIGGVPITFFGLLKAVLIVLASIWISNIVGRTLKRISKRKGRQVEPTVYVFRRIIHYIILLLGVLIALSSLGLTFRNLAIILGALSIGVGFGLQNIVNNFLCGLTILFERNIKIGDFIELEAGHVGKITEINVQNTTIHTYDGLDILIPNSSIMGNNVINWTKRDPYQRLHIPFGVAYGTDQEWVSKVVSEAAMKVSYTITEGLGVAPPEVWLVNFGDSALNFELVVWVNIFKSRGQRAMKASYIGEIEKALKEAGIKIPFPQRDLHLKSFPKEEALFVKQ